MAIGCKLPDEFRKNFSDSMYGSEVVSVRKTENPDYCLVYYNSNESDVGLGMVPEDQPVLTDGKGNKLAFDRLDGPQNNGSEHVYILDDKVVVVSGVSAEERYKPNPILEMERDSGLLRRILATFRSDADRMDGGFQREPYFYEDALVSMLSSHEITFAHLKDAYTEGLIAHRLEASGRNVTAACVDAAKELGMVQPFRKFLDEFFSFAADLIEEGRISRAGLHYCLLDDISNKFPEVYKKVRDSALVDKSEVYGKIFEILLDLIDYGDHQYNVGEFPLRGVEIVLNGETIPVKSISKIGFDGFRDKPFLETILADLNCLDGNGSYTFIFTSDDSYSYGWDDVTGHSPVLKNPDSMLSALSGVKNVYEIEAYREGVISVLQEAYKAARPTNEVVRGNYAGEFEGEVKWSKAMDFSVPGMPEFKGLRYIDFPDCTLIRLLMKDGNSKPVNELTKTELGMVRDGLQKALKNRKGVRM